MYMESRKIVLMSLFAEKEWRHILSIENGLVDTVGDGKGRTKEKAALTYIHYHVF